MSKPHSHSVDWLREEYDRRKQVNPRYSLRSFARHLGVPSGPLSEILAKKRTLSLKLGRKIAEKLAYNREEEAQFCSLIEKEMASQSMLRRFAPPKGELPSYRPLAMDRFALIAEWYHFALLALLETEGCVPRTSWIAKRLGITVHEAREAMARLQRMGLVEIAGDRWVPKENLTTSHDVPSTALRRHHRQNLERAIESLEKRTVEERDISSITMAIDPQKLPLAKQAILRFRRELAKLLEDGTKREVYQLQVLLVPVTKKEKG